MIIIGITGTTASGKGTIVDYLKSKGFKHFSVRGFLTKELERRSMPVNRDTMVALGNELRARHSPSYLAECLYDEAAASGENCIIESLRAVGEIAALRQKGNFFLLALDAEPAARFSRLTARGSITDHISFEKFLEEEKREWESSDPNKQNLSACIALADFKIMTNGTIEESCAAAEVMLEQIVARSH